MKTCIISILWLNLFLYGSCYQISCLTRAPVVCDYENLSIEADTSKMSQEIRNIIIAAGNSDNGKRLYEHGLRRFPNNPSILFNFAKYLEPTDLGKANHLYFDSYRFGKHQGKDEFQRTSLELREKNERLHFQNLDILKAGLNAKHHIVNSSLIKKIEDTKEIEYVHNTVALEGNTLSFPFVKELLETGNIPESASLREVGEVFGAKRALDFVKEYVKEHRHVCPIFTKELILKIHFYMVHIVNVEYAGKYRDDNVTVLNHRPCPPNHIPDLMEKFVNWLNSKDFWESYPTERAALTHYQLFWIHPFIDGNKRTSRMLMNLILMLDDFPLTILSVNEINEYHEALTTAISQKSGDTRPFISYITEKVEDNVSALDIIFKLNE